MKLERLYITNFGSWTGFHDLRLSGAGLVLVEGRNLDDPGSSSNGSGKSTLFEALDWALWGRTVKGDSLDEMISRGQTGCTVTVEMEDDAGTSIRVTRAREAGKSTLALFVGGAVVSALDMAETQKRIEQLLGLDRDIWHAAVYYSQQDTVRWADATDAERMEILTQALQLEEFDRLEERAREKLKSLEQQLASLDQQQATLRGKLSMAQSAEFQRLAGEWDQTQARQRAQLQQQLTSAREFVANSSEVLSALEVLRERVARSVAADTMSPEHAAVIRERDERNAEHTHLAFKLQELDRLMIQIQDRQGTTCVTCGQKVGYEHVVQQAAEVWKQRNTVATQLEEVGAKRQELEETVTRLTTELRERSAAVQAQREADIRQMSVLSVRGNQLRVAQADVVRLERQLAEPVLNPWAGKVVEAQVLEAALHVEEAQVGARIRVLQVERDHVQWWVGAAGKSGIRSYILDARIQEITASANRWLAVLSDNGMWLVLDPQTATKTRGVKNKLSLHVYRYQEAQVLKQPYASLSGGERQRVALAIDLALAEIVSRRTARSWDVLILDEVFRHLDSAGRQRVVDVLRRLKSGKSAVFVIDHDAEFGSQFESRWVVEKRGGGSRLLTGDICGSQVESKAAAVDSESSAEGTEKARGATRRRKMVAVDAPGDDGGARSPDPRRPSGVARAESGVGRKNGVRRQRSPRNKSGRSAVGDQPVSAVDAGGPDVGGAHT